MKSPMITVTIALALASGGIVAAQSTPQDAMPPHGATTRTTPAAATPTAPAAINMTTHETQTLDELHAANLIEVAAGKLAQRNAASSDVKKYGEHLVMEHSKADKELTTLAKRNGVKLTGVDTDKKLYDLKGLKGSDFDHAFLNMMVKDHAQVIELVKTEEARAQNQDVRALLTKTLPVLQQHEQRAQVLNNDRG
jgi:putative membrane protein